MSYYGNGCDSDMDPNLEEMVESDSSDSDSGPAALGKKKVVYTLDEGFLFEWDGELSGHNLWFELYEGSSEHLQFQSNFKSTPLNSTNSTSSTSTTAKISKSTLFQKFLLKHPFGIAELPCKKILESTKQELDFMTIKKIPYPGTKPIHFLANEATVNLDMMKLVGRLCHRIKVLVSFNEGILKTDQVFTQLKTVFGLTLDPKRWGFQSSAHLIEVLMMLVPMSDVRIISLTQTGSDSSSSATYLVIADGTCPRINKLVDDEEELRKKMKKTSAGPGALTLAYQYCVRYQAHLNYVSSFIEERQSHECYWLAVYSPTDFYVILADNFAEMNAFQECLNKYYNGGDILPVVPKHRLLEGMYVAVQNKKKEWCRGVVKKSYDEHTDKCNVYLLEFGEDIRVNGGNVRMLAKRFFHAYYAQAIHCRLRFRPDVQKYIKHLENTGKESSVFKTFSKVREARNGVNKAFLVQFKKHVHVKENEFIWEVDMYSVVGKSDRFLELSTKHEGGIAQLLVHHLTAKHPVPDILLGKSDAVEVETDSGLAE